MRTSYFAKQFDRDVKSQKKRGKDISKLKAILRDLVEEKQLAVKNRDHYLSGDFAGYRECHIEPDWLLIYKLELQTIYFVRTGTHSDLFD